MNNSIKKWQLGVIIFLLIFCQGCAEMPLLDSEDTIIAPKNKLIPIQGSWEIKEFKPVSSEDSIAEEYEDWIGEKAIFTDSFVVLANEQCVDAKYKIRTVDSRNYFLFHYGIDSEDLNIKELKMDIISVSSDDKPFYDFIKIQDDRAIFYASGGFYIIEKLSNIVEDEYIDHNTVNKEEKGQEKTEQELLRSGILLGLRTKYSVSGQEDDYNLRSTYRTIWIASYNRTLNPILEVSDLFVPRRSGFWRVGIKTRKIDEYMQDFLFANPIEQEFLSSIETSDDMLKQPGEIIKNIVFVGDDYVALEYMNIIESNIEDNRYQVLPLDDVNSDKGIRISDIARKDGKDIFYTSAETHLLSRNIKIPGKIEEFAHEDNFTLVRRNGHWILRGRFNYNNKPEDFTIGLSPINTLVNYDELHVPWDSIKEKVPAAVDAYTSPNEDILLVVTESYIEIYAIKDREIAENPLRRIKIRDGETVVMAEWATGEYVARWEKSLSQLNPFIINDF